MSFAMAETSMSRKRTHPSSEAGPETSLQLGFPCCYSSSEEEDLSSLSDPFSSDVFHEGLLPLSHTSKGSAASPPPASISTLPDVEDDDDALHYRFECYKRNHHHRHDPPAITDGHADADADANSLMMMMMMPPPPVDMEPSLYIRNNKTKEEDNPIPKKCKADEEQGSRLYGRKPQFRDHIWAYAQMFRAESSMAFVSGGGDGVEAGDELGAKRGEGVELVQLLFACAEAVACRDARQASAIIQDLAYLVSPYGSSLQRVSTCFIQGLAARLALLIHPNDHNYKQQLQLALPVNNIKEPCYKDKEEALRLVYDICPYIPFGHYAANAAIMEAFGGEDYVHVVDLGMTSGLARGLQWSCLIHDLAARPGGAPKLVRITGIGVSAAAMTEIGGHIKEQAEGLNVPFEFQAVEISLEKMTPSMIDISAREALAVNSVLELHCVVKESRGSLNSVLQAIHKLRPRVLTLVEQDASHNGPFFLGRFMEALYYYSAIFDSLDATLPRPSTQRVKIEQYYFGEEIKNIVSCEGPGRVERHERVDQWRRRMSRAGFQSSPYKILSQATAWLRKRYPCEAGYTLCDEKGCLVLGWRGKPIIAASCWKC